MKSKLSNTGENSTYKSSVWLKNKSSIVLPYLKIKSQKETKNDSDYLTRPKIHIEKLLDMYVPDVRDETKEVFQADKWLETQKCGKNIFFFKKH